MLFVGLDVIGDYVTEINVTSPTGVRELDQPVRHRYRRLADGCDPAPGRGALRSSTHGCNPTPRSQDSDRLATCVFVAALLHGLLILGVRFSAPAADDTALPTLEVLLVPPGRHCRGEPNLTAGYIAQRAQRGTGTGPQDQRSSLPEMLRAVRRHAAVFRDGGVDAEPAERSAGHDFGAGATRPRGATVTRRGRIARDSAGRGIRHATAARPGRAEHRGDRPRAAPARQSRCG